MKKSFLPLITCHTHSLFLGTLPSEKSLFERQYYAHPQNKFWRLVYDVFEEVYNEDYEKRIAFLLQQGFGLWDVLDQAEREGSLDTAIKNYEINDFEQLYQNHPQIKKLYFTSKQDRKSTRLNSSHVRISYAVFCLKKKKIIQN